MNRIHHRAGNFFIITNNGPILIGRNRFEVAAYVCITEGRRTGNADLIKMGRLAMQLNEENAHLSESSSSRRRI